MNRVYGKYFSKNLRARSFVGARGLALPELVVEIEGVAEAEWGDRSLIMPPGSARRCKYGHTGGAG